MNTENIGVLVVVNGDLAEADDIVVVDSNYFHLGFHHQRAFVFWEVGGCGFRRE